MVEVPTWWVGLVRLVRLVGFVGCYFQVFRMGQTNHPSQWREQLFGRSDQEKCKRRLQGNDLLSKKEGENTKNKVFSTLFWQMIFGISRLSTEVVSSIYEISIDVPSH